MRLKFQWLVAALLACIASGPAQAQEPVTRVYRGVVALVDGPQSGAIQAGDPVTVTFTVDPTDPDLDPNPQAGYFLHAVQRLTVALPNSDLEVSGSGQLQTFDNTANPDDQVTLYIPTITEPDQLQGRAVLALEVGFTGYPRDASSQPDMITSDAIPTGRLDSSYSNVLIATDLGWTGILLTTLVAEPTVSELASDGMQRLREAMDAGLVQQGVGNALAAKLGLLDAANKAGQTQRACAMLTAFGAQLQVSAHGHVLDATVADELRTLAGELEQVLGGC